MFKYVLRKENNELAIICRSPFQVLCAIEYLRSNIIEDYTFYLLSLAMMIKVRR